MIQGYEMGHQAVQEDFQPSKKRAEAFMQTQDLPYGFVRGDLFNPSGRWLYRVTIDMTNTRNQAMSCRKSVQRAYWSTPSSLRGVAEDYGQGLTLVVIKPHHELSHPIMVTLTSREDCP